ncbi:hypothetical protein MTR_2g461900 [Medicago truncatula]|uniref:Uncharacterized protein n=1 Tax=Medicago truncatula TaxID=3880 RepID=A0A072V8H6_MEDTR|nr:hypothetical protein MTR_2g461900 [Medicago truncatula]
MELITISDSSCTSCSSPSKLSTRKPTKLTVKKIVKNVVSPPYAQTEDNGHYIPPERCMINQAKVTPVSTLGQRTHSQREDVRHSQSQWNINQSTQSGI